jgi:hypothetical protein
MATVIRELQESKPVEVQAGQKTATRRFAVFDDTTPANFTRPDQVENIFGTGVFPNDMPTYGSAFPGMTTLMAMEPRIKPMPGNPYVWEVEWAYLRTNFVVGSQQPYEVGYREFSYEATGQFVDAWRTTGAAFIGASQSGTPVGLFTDIGGTAIDSGGDPTSLLLIQQVFSVLEVVEGSTLGGTFAAYIGKRNASPYLGASAGRLVYAGIQSTTRVATGIFARTHRIVWDAWCHMRQQPLRDEDGTVVKFARDDGGGLTTWHASYVRWVQPYPSTMDFGIFGTP